MMNLKKENLILTALSVLLGRAVVPEKPMTVEQKAVVQGLIDNLQEAVKENFKNMKSTKKKK